VPVPANSLAYSDNILEDLFDVTSGSGSLLVAAFAEDNPGVPDEVVDLAFLVNSETYNDHPNGTYGQTIPGAWTGLLGIDYDGISAIAQGIRNAGRFRTNVGAVNLGACEVTLRVSVFDVDGNTILDAAPFDVPPYGHIQDRLPISVGQGSIEFWVDDPCWEDDARYAVVFPYTSTIDQNTGDPSYQTPTLLAVPGDLYAKGQNAKARNVDPHNVGKKIDAKVAARVRASANSLGVAKLERTERGLAIMAK
jgi:hypothetical protein